MSVKKISLNDLSYDAYFRFSRRARYLSIRINSDNRIEVVLPYGYKIERAESFLHQKSDWIKKHLTKPSFTKYLYFGKPLQVIQNFNLFNKIHLLKLQGDHLIITSPSGSSQKIDNLFELWLKREAKIYITARAAQLAKGHDLHFNSIRIKGQRTRWGSCSSKKNLSFNYRLMKHDKEVIDYVIIHELCHLREMNHSRKFWDMVKIMCPEYQILKKKLNK